MKNIAIFASGSGTNAERVVAYFKDIPDIKVKLILSNNPKAYVLERAKKLKVNTCVFNKDQFFDTDNILLLLKKNNIDFVVLAGFLWFVPSNIVTTYHHKIINIHPALLPKYGGKGMYGMKVHQAVMESKDLETGITIHHVNNKYDEGTIIFQAKCKVEPTDTAQDIAQKVHKLEYKYFPKIIHQLLTKN